MIRQKLAPQRVVDILKAEYIPAYRLHLWFSDGAEQDVDFEPFLRAARHPDIVKYLDPELFRQFTIMHGRLDWNDYDLCFPLEDLYEGTIGQDAAQPQGKARPNRQPRRVAVTPEREHGYI